MYTKKTYLKKWKVGDKWLCFVNVQKNELEEQTQILILETHFTPTIIVIFSSYLPKERLCCQA